jgi:hypothetical protein
MGQKNKGDRPRAPKNVYKRRLAVAVWGIGKCRQVNKARSLAPTDINIIDGVASPKWGGEACTARR